MRISRCTKCMRELPEGQAFCPHCGWKVGTPAEAFALKPGTILDGKYLVGEMLGRGGFGITYIGFDLLLEQKVAIKEYFPMGIVTRANASTVVWSSSMLEKTGTEKGFDSFLKEARKMAKLGSIEGVVGVKTLFIENETAYIVMDFVEGETLQKKLKRDGKMAFDDCLALLMPIMQALSQVHKHGIIHRDISPDNIMIQPDGRPMLLDLGAAKDLSLSNGDVALSQPTQMVAKHGFSPTEQYMQTGKITAATDVYAMAATIYYCCTGSVPLSAFDRLVEDNLCCKPLLDEIQFRALAAGMEVKADRRLQSMDALIQALQEAAQESKKEAAAQAEREAAERARREAEEEAARKAAEKAARKAEQEAARKAAQEAAEKAKQEAAEKARLEAERKAAEKAARKAEQEAARRAAREAAAQAKQETAEKKTDTSSAAKGPGRKWLIPAALLVVILAAIPLLRMTRTPAPDAAVEAIGLTEPAAVQKETAAAPEAVTPPVTKVFNIGICQLVAHPALDAATQGFMDALTEKLGDNVNFDLQNAQGDSAACSVITTNFVSNGVDLIMANATPALLAAVSATDTIPVLGTSVTDFASALQVSPNAAGALGINVSGVCDDVPAQEYVDCLRELVPNAKKVYVVCCSAEPISVLQANSFLAASNFAECSLITCSSAKDLLAVVTDATKEADALYIPTGNTAASIMADIARICESAGIPVICGEEGMCVAGGLATVSISYYNIGHVCGDMAYDILVNGADVSTMPIGYDNAPTKKYNPDCAAALGLTIPDGYTAVFDQSAATRTGTGFYTMMAMPGVEKYETAAKEPFWGQKKYIRSDVTAIVFQSSMDNVPKSAWDVSEAKDKSVMAWMDGGTLTVAADGTIRPNADASNLFEGFVNLKSIDFGGCFDTSNVKNMIHMFSFCESLTELDLSDFDTSNVTYMIAMFQWCRELLQLDVSHFDTSKATSMRFMFAGCTSLTSLDVSHFDTSKVTDMDYMFYACQSLTSLDLSSFDTAKVTSMCWMFDDCRSLTNLDLSGFTTIKSTKLTDLFLNCGSLTDLKCSDRWIQEAYKNR